MHARVVISILFCSNTHFVPLLDERCTTSLSYPHPPARLTMLMILFKLESMKCMTKVHLIDATQLMESRAEKPGVDVRLLYLLQD
jgi:hypothetical protein